MSLTAGPVWVFAALLVVAGLDKVRAPAATVGALRQSRLPASPAMVLALGTIETIVGIYAIVFGDRLSAVALVILYAGFSGFVVNALVRNLPVASCGCFAKVDTPPSWIHVAITLFGIAAGVGAAVDPPGVIGDVLAVDSASALLVAGTGIAFAFAYMSLTALPKTLGAAKRL